MAGYLKVSCAVILRGPTGLQEAFPAPITHVLATQRSAHMPHPLRWEFPGGKLREGESAEESIVREIMEELGVEVQVLGRLEPVEHRYDQGSIRLIPLLCSLAHGVRDSHIRLSEHAAWKWVPVEQLGRLDWLEADLGVLSQINV